jgi:two-component system, OmpR family, response regulator
VHLVVVDDDPAIRALLMGLLASAGYVVHEASNGEQLRRVLAQHPIQLILLDLSLGAEDGLQIAREVRTHHDVAIIMVTAKGDEIDRVVGLELGADDYIVKPFNLREVVARVRAVLRRCAATADAGDKVKSIRFGEWVIDVDASCLKRHTGEVVPLTRAEYELLEVLARRPGRLLSREVLLELTKGPNSDVFDRSIDTLIGRLRKKIEVNSDAPEHIKTVRGMGYLFSRVES